MSAAYICDGIRTPIGRFGGALANVRADDLAAIAIKALMARNAAVDWSAVDDVVLGCANQAGEDNRNVARMAALLAGLPETVPGITVNRLCASGLEAVAYAARAIMADQADLIIAGGVESMTRAPFVVGKADSAFSRTTKIEDDRLALRQPGNAESLWHRFNARNSRECCRRVRHWPRRSGCLRAEKPAAGEGRRRTRLLLGRDRVGDVPGKAGPTSIDRDEHPRPDTTTETLTMLSPIVRKDGTVTAGNSSGVNDGAAAMIVVSEAAIALHGLTPRARVAGYATAGVAPRIMGIGRYLRRGS